MKTVSDLLKDDLTTETKLALIGQDICYIKEAIRQIQIKLDANYVTKTEYEPVKRLVYGLVALILTSVVVALVSLIV